MWRAGRCALRRKVSHVAGTQTGAIHQYGHLDTATFRKVRNEAGVLDVAVDGPRLAGDERVHDERAVLDAPAQREVLSGEQFATGLGVLEEVLLAAPDVLVNRYVVEFDQLIVPEEVGYVLGVVLARLGDEVPEAAHQLEAHLVFGVHVRVFQGREEPRVGILAFHFEARHPGDVVDAGALVEKVLMLDADVRGYLARGVRDAMAEPDALYLGAGCVECLHQDAHRVRVVKEQRFRREFAHLAGEVKHEGDGTQSAEDAAYTHRVGDRLLETVLFGDLEVEEGGLVHPDLDHVHDEVSPIERPSPIEMLLHFRTCAELIRGPAGHHASCLQTLGVYVVQGDGGSTQLGEAKGIRQKILGKDHASRADKGYLQDLSFLLVRCQLQRLLQQGHPRRGDVDAEQPGLEIDGVVARNAAPAVQHLYCACACVVLEMEHDALFERAVYHEQCRRDLSHEWNDRVPVGCCDQLRPRAREHEGVVCPGVERLQGAIQKHVAMSSPEAQPETQHLHVLGRYPVEKNRDLGHAEDDVYELKRRALYGVLGVPHEHVGVGGCVPAEQPDVQGVHPVLDGVVRAIHRPEHIAVLAHQGPDVTLAELHHHVGLYPAQAHYRILQEPVDRLWHTVVIAATAGLLRSAEAIHEIELDPVEVPLPQGRLVGLDQELAHFGKARVEYASPEAFDLLEQHSRKPLPCFAVEADERYGVPEEIFHPEGVHPIYVRAHVRDLLGRGLPIAGVGVAPLVARGLPAVVYDHRLASQFLRQPALLLDALRVEFLVEAVPRRVHRRTRRGWHPGRLVTRQTCPPAAYVG